uniref:Myosin N-terminal SH3-like domain-containing protein n=1 Tax=Hucho hucho TaxID=62062 RepID=A0A4W5PNQ4_9TELE
MLSTSTGVWEIVCPVIASGASSACGVAIAVMSLLDANEFGEAGTFLCKPDLELLAAKTIAFDGKKRAWVPDEKEAYIEVEIKELNGDKVIVETKDRR